MVVVKWKGGGEATLEKFSEERADLVSTRAFPPGARVEGELEGNLVLRLKVHGSTKTTDGKFRVHGRPLDLTRVLRDMLIAATNSAPPTA